MVFSTKDRGESDCQRSPGTGVFAYVWMVFSTKDRGESDSQRSPGTGVFAYVWMVFSTKDRERVTVREAQGQDRGESDCQRSPGTGVFAYVWMVFSTKDRGESDSQRSPGTGVFAYVWMVFSTKDRGESDCQRSPGTGVFAYVWMVFSTKDREESGSQRSPGTGMFVCVWMVFSTKDRGESDCQRSPGTGVFAYVWIMFSTKDRGESDSQRSPGTGVFAYVWMVFSTKDRGESDCQRSPGTGVFAYVWMVFSTKDRGESDNLGAGLFNVLPDIVHRLTVEWIAGDFMCKLIKYIQGGVLYGSTYVLVALSVDRYDAIIHPMRFAHDRKSKAMICVAWGLAALFSIPSPVIFALRMLPNGEWQCWAEWPEDWYWTPYMTIVTTLVFFIPLVIISTCYIFIVVKIWRRSKELVQERKFIGEKCIPMTPRTFTQSNNKGSPDDQADDDSSPVKKRGCVGSLRGPKGKKIMRQPSSQGIIPKAKIKTIKLSLAIITAPKKSREQIYSCAKISGVVASGGVVDRAIDYEPGDPGLIRTRYMSEHAPRRCALGKGTLHDFPHSTQV
ncbi:Neuropeptide S receptor [Branchiostoma belcheri]|nr:Neuropeptide S receptor [Branchiostoma belcheri]